MIKKESIKQCKKEKYQENRTPKIKYQKAKYQENLDVQLVYKKSRQQENPEIKIIYQENPEILREDQKGTKKILNY